MRGTKKNIVGISGSLRNNSSNTAILKIISTFESENADFHIYERIGELPHFNPELDESPPTIVDEFRKVLKEADGVVICTPEYAFGVPGVLKNALDWTVSSGELAYKPVAVITASTGGEKAHASLLLTLTALSSKVPASSTLLISFVRTKINANGEVTDPATLLALQSVYQSLLSGVLSPDNE
jgi:NAD(P)H-dependent FMN reductase